MLHKMFKTEVIELENDLCSQVLSLNDVTLIEHLSAVIAFRESFGFVLSQVDAKFLRRK